MRLSDQFIDELKARLRPSEVIGKRMTLKKQGREWAGLSPFAKEKSPSFFVNDDKGFYHCFSSGKHGDIISFVQEVERLSFMEAVEKLAAEAGLPLPAADPKAEQRLQVQTGLREALEAARGFYMACLQRATGQEARSYLQRRGCPPDVWQQFQLGYAPEGRTALRDELVAKGFQQKTLIDAGLIVKTEDGAILDRFRNRLMFPILDARGRMIAFGGRALDAQARAKYLNSPETPLFHKGATLYNLASARALQARDGGALYVVEGYMDVIACQRAGLAAVAPLGTALTETQLELLWRVVDEPVLCFDGDGAGRRAAGRAAERALPLLKPGKSLHVVLMADGRDPDDVLRDAGADALRAALAAPQPLVDVVFAAARDAMPVDTPERQAGLRARLRQLSAQIADPDVREAYAQALEVRRRALFPDVPASDTGWQVGPGPGGKWAKGKGGRVPSIGKRVARLPDDADDRLPAQILATILARPDLLIPLSEPLSALPCTTAASAALRDALLHVAMQVADDPASEGLDKDALMRHLRHMGKEGLVRESGLDALLPFHAANPAVPVHEAQTMMAEAMARITDMTAPVVPSADGVRRQAMQAMAALRSARVAGGARRVLGAADPE